MFNLRSLLSIASSLNPFQRPSHPLQAQVMLTNLPTHSVESGKESSSVSTKTKLSVPEVEEEVETQKDPLDAEFGTRDGVPGYFFTVYFPVYPLRVKSNQLKHKESGLHFASQVVMVRPQVTKIIIPLGNGTYPGPILVTPEQCLIELRPPVKGPRSLVLYQPQSYSFWPPSTFYSNTSPEYQVKSKLPRYKRAEPTEYDPTKGIIDVPKGKTGHWYVIHFDSYQVTVPETRDPETGRCYPSQKVQVIHPPEPVLVEWRRLYRGPVEISITPEVYLNYNCGLIAPLSVLLSEKKYLFWPPPERQTVPTSLHEDSRLPFNRRLVPVSETQTQLTF